MGLPHQRESQLKRGKPLTMPTGGWIMIPHNNSSLPIKNQVEKNSFSYKEEKIELIEKCKIYCDFISSINNSPWQKYKNTIYEFKKGGITGLSSHQISMIHFLSGFFKHGKPCYFKQNNIAKKLNISRTRVVKILNSLQEREIILKVNYRTGNIYSKHQVMILPNIPNLNSIVDKILTTNGTYQTAHTVCSLLVCKSSKSIMNFSPLYYMIFKSSYMFFKELNINIYGGSLRSLTESQIDSSNLKEKKPMRLQLKRKEIFDTPKIESKNIREKFKRGKKYFDDSDKTINDLEEAIEEIKSKPINQRKIPLKIMNKLNYLIINKYGPEYGVEFLFKSLKNIGTAAGNIDNALFMKFFDLIKYDAKLDYINTVKLIHCFNATKENNTKVRCMRVDKNTQEFKKVSIIVSALLCHHPSEALFKSIERFSKYGNYSKLRYCKQISLLPFLLNPREEDYLDVFMNEEDDGAVFSSLNSINTKYSGIQADWKKIYMRMFPDPEDGKKYYKRNKYGLMKFLENIVETAQKDDLNLCGRHFAKKNKQGEESIMKEYLIYLSDKFGKKDKVITMKLIVDFTNWMDFIQERMRDEYELNNFFKPAYFNNKNH
jgi:hypothetical protein